MAVDEALLSCFDPENSAPLLRLYGWSPPALSLGRFQDTGAVLDLDRCRADNLPVVRRITGGGVIYHADELTYSIVCAPHHLPRAATVKESFRILTAFLLQFYRDLGLDAGYAIDSCCDPSNLGERTAFCFAGKESLDILVDGRKIGGNAQRRLRNAIFQHGSIPLHNLVAKGLSYLLEKPVGVDVSVVALAETGVDVQGSLLKSALEKAFVSAFKTTLSVSGLTEKEKKQASELLRFKYGSDAWNLSGEEL